MARLFLFLLVIASLHAEEVIVAKATLPPRGRFLIFLLAGQSNMSGRGTAETANHEGDARILVFRDGGWQVAADPLHRDKPKVVGVGPGLAFARALRRHLPTDISIGLVPAAFGGTKLAWWAKDYVGDGQRWPDGSTLYANALAQTRAAMKDGRLAGLLWNQGESDAGEAEQEDGTAYRRALHELIRNFRADLGEAELPFVAATLGPWKKDDAAKLNAVVIALPGEMPYTAVLDTLAPAIAARLHRKPDDLPHYDAPSARLLGELYAEAMWPLLR